MTAECTWEGDLGARTIRHIVYCPACSERWPLVADYYRDEVMAQDADHGSEYRCRECGNIALYRIDHKPTCRYHPSRERGNPNHN